jgi:ribosomal protein S18 acetylase RimI-like enzyme
MSKVKPKIRRLESGDAATAAALIRQFHSSVVPPDRIESLLSNEWNFLVVAEVEGDLAGFVWAYRLERLYGNPFVIFLYEIEVAPAYRRKGVGAELITFIRELSNRERPTEMFLFTNHSNAAAVEFYNSTGAQMKNGDDLLFVYPAL